LVPYACGSGAAYLAALGGAKHHYVYAKVSQSFQARSGCDCNHAWSFLWSAWLLVFSRKHESSRYRAYHRSWCDHCMRNCLAVFPNVRRRRLSSIPLEASCSSCLSFGSLLTKQLCILVDRHLLIWLSVLRRPAHQFDGLKGLESSGIVCVSSLSGALPKALKLGAQAFNNGSSACKVSQ
jgi:hypothetical protein